ncbi:NfeD family protein [Noviherbaspirillum pedocola]|uniref:NfeD family protein n=1 Tax=Noviherbaspirillum pedocola TaxID=2801341 RepID=A0A934SS77_9BURK|nr:NfeD family protein [Noviherbaspirillum pedocola]MBK4734554.1 NfeD family protein [Noviherbaspirillum pedocola]
MSDWIVWIALAAALVILEIFSGTFYLLMVALGALAGAAAAWAGAGMEAQLVLAGLVGSAATLLLHRMRRGRPRPDRNPDLNLDIGQTVDVSHWQAGVARVSYRGALWDVELASGAEARPGRFVIREVHGSRLVVSNETH